MSSTSASTNSRRRIVVGITGASGALYAQRLVQLLEASAAEVHLIVTPYGQRLLRDELQLKDISVTALLGSKPERVTLHDYHDLTEPLASGSYHTDGMVVCPCSSNSLAALAAGLAGNLLERAAAVTLKEARRLIVVPREMPVSRLDLLNALRLQEAGAVICPAAPGFYHQPRTLSDLADFVAGKLLDLLGMHHELDTRWSGQMRPRESTPPSAP